MLDEKNKSSQLKVAYLHGRPSAHPLHKKLAASLGSDFYFVDKYLRWQDKDKSVFFRMFSSFINAILYSFKKYNIILVDNLHFAPIFAKKMRLFSKKKYAVHLGSHTLFFLYDKRYSPLVTKIHLWALKNYDLLVCEGEMAKELVYKLLPGFDKKVEVSFLGPTSERNRNLVKIEPKLSANKILIIATGPGEFRKYYKGLDIMINAFELAISQMNNLELEIVGYWEQSMIDECLKNKPENVVSKINFSGNTNDIESKLESCSLLLHCSRGDAFPTSTIEAMAAGVPVLASVWTGTKQLIKEVDDNFIVELDIKKIADKIVWYYNLPLENKKIFSDKFRRVSLKFTEELAVERYKQIFNSIGK